MKKLSVEQLEYAGARLEQLVTYRGLAQVELAKMSGVTQPTISKVLSHSKGEDDDYSLTEDVLTKLFQGLGYNIFDILNEPDCLPDKVVGYLATPLTALSQGAHKTLRKVVGDVRAIAADQTFNSFPFDIYWPGDHTHPHDHASVSARQVYLTDRSRASTHNFVILFCGDPSYGVGQENEIATQAGIPAIRLIPQNGLSRMMHGSFVRAIDIKYEGSLESSIRIPRDELLNALRDTRKLYFRHRAFYHRARNGAFAVRLKQLIDDRFDGDYIQCANDLGVSLEYLHILMRESMSVSNPGALLLDRIAVRLCTHVGYLLGESEVTDPVYVESNASWRKWIDTSSGVGVDAAVALKMRDTWREQWHTSQRARGEMSIASHRNGPKVMQATDWDQLYQNTMKAQGGQHPIQQKLL